MLKGQEELFPVGEVSYETPTNRKLGFWEDFLVYRQKVRPKRNQSAIQWMVLSGVTKLSPPIPDPAVQNISLVFTLLSS